MGTIQLLQHNVYKFLNIMYSFLHVEKLLKSDITTHPRKLDYII